MSRHGDEDGYPRGVWVGAGGVLHVDVDEVIAGAGYEPTEDNRRVLLGAVADLARRDGFPVETRCAHVAVDDETGVCRCGALVCVACGDEVTYTDADGYVHAHPLEAAAPGCWLHRYPDA